MNEPIHRGHTIFCDDIRNEQGNKTTLVGVYDAEMRVNGDFPFLVPKFGLAIRYLEMRGAYKDEPVTLRVYMPGDEESVPSFEAQIPDVVEMRKSVKTHPITDQSAPRYLQVTTNVVISPLILAKEGQIKVRAQCGSEIVRLGALWIIRGDDPIAAT